LVWRDEHDDSPECGSFRKENNSWRLGDTFKPFWVSTAHRAIPMAWIEAAPGMREALKGLVETDSGMSNQREFNIARAALAACDGKGE